MTHLSGTPDSITAYFPDPRRPRLEDMRARYQFFKGSESTSHSTLTVGNEQSTLISAPLRIRQAQVEGVTGGTVTVQVTVDGRDLFSDAHRPVSDSGGKEVSDLYVIPAGSVVKTIIEASSGVPAGTANVLIDTEPFELVEPIPDVKLTGRDRLFSSRRRLAEAIDTEGGLIAEFESVTVPIGSAPEAQAIARDIGGVREYRSPIKPGGGIKFPKK